MTEIEQLIPQKTNPSTRFSNSRETPHELFKRIIHVSDIQYTEFRIIKCTIYKIT